MNELIRERLIGQEMERLGVTVSAAEIDAELEREARRYNSDLQSFKNGLKEQGISFDQYRESVSDRLKLLKFIKRRILPKIDIETMDLENFYNRNSDKFAMPDEFNLIRINLKTKKRSKES